MKLFARINLSSADLRRGILVSTFALAVAAICGCLESDVVIYDGDTDNIVWGSIGTDGQVLDCSLRREGLGRRIHISPLRLLQQRNRRPRAAMVALVVEDTE